MNGQRDGIGCEEAIRRLAAYLDHELEPAEATEVERHIEQCRSCYSRAEFERLLRERIRTDLDLDEVPEATEQRIRTLLRQLPHVS